MGPRSGTEGTVPSMGTELSLPWERSCPLLPWDWKCPFHGNGTGAGAGAQGTPGRTQTAPLRPPEPGEPPSLHPQHIHGSLHPTRPQAELCPWIRSQLCLQLFPLPLESQRLPAGFRNSGARSLCGHGCSQSAAGTRELLPAGMWGQGLSVQGHSRNVLGTFPKCAGDIPLGATPMQLWPSGLGFWEFSLPRGFRRLKSQGSGIPARVSGEIFPRISLTIPTNLCKCTGSLKMPVFSVSRSGGHGFLLGCLGVV